MRRAGSARPEATSAARTRSRASETALSGRPTTLNAGSPGATWTWTSTARASTPSNATVATRCTMPAPALPDDVSAWTGKEQYGNRLSPAFCLDPVPDHGGNVRPAEILDCPDTGGRGHIDLGEIAVDHVDADEEKLAL